MSKKTFEVHRHCGTRVVYGEDRCPYCPRCNKWLIGDAIDRVRKVKA